MIRFETLSKIVKVVIIVLADGIILQLINSLLYVVSFRSSGGQSRSP